MTKTKAIALFVGVVGSFLYFKTIFFPPDNTWEIHNQAGLAAYIVGNYPEAEKHFKASLKIAGKKFRNNPRCR